MLKPGCPEVIRHSESIFKRLADPQHRHHSYIDPQLFHSVLDENDEGWPEPEIQQQHSSQSLPADLRQVFKKSNLYIPLQGRLLSNILIGGLVYSTFSKHRGNSCVLATLTKGQTPVPAQIEHIIEVLSGDVPVTYFAIRRFKPMASAIHHDPFTAYPFLRAKLWDAGLDDTEIILPSQLACHFACLPVTLNERQLIVCLSLSRVSLVI